MSRSNNVELRNPAVKRFEWSGGEGIFRYYDKELKQNIDVQLPFRFMVLDTLHTLSGWSDADQSGFWSNEIRDIKKDLFSVRNKKGHCGSGLYESVQYDPNCKGIKYAQSVYIAYYDEGQLQICNLQIKGAALGSWIEMRKKEKIFNGAIEVTEYIDAKKGKTKYKIPVFKKIESSPESEAKATALDKELQEYLTVYLNREPFHNREEIDKTEPVAVDTVPVGDHFDNGDDLPF